MRDGYDLIVVGTGFASTFFLYQYLLKARPEARVLVLERGYLFPYASRRSVLARSADAPVNRNPEPHQTYRNHNPEKHWAFSIGFGGSSNCWYACTPRFLPSDFRTRSLYGVGRDWPLQYEDLDPYYTMAEDLMSIAGPDETPFPKNSRYPLPPHQLSTVDRILKKEYGALYTHQPTARASRAVNGRNACCTSAVCGLCPVNAKFTIENSNMKVYDDPRVKVMYGAQVTSIDSAGGVAQGVNFISGGRAKNAGGEAIALGANAIFNASILLNSHDPNPLTGKGLGEQLGLDAVVFLDGLENVGGGTWVNANGYMLYDGAHRKHHAACLIESNNAPYIRIESGRWRQVAVFRMIFEDLPGEHNFISSVEGHLPEAHFGGHSDYARRGVEHMKSQLPSLLSCLPVEKIEFLAPFKTEAHILGTTPMSHSPADGVVDRNMIHHRYRNVFVLGAGSFPTFTPSNPTLTLCAMSLMAADRSF